ncbi:unnamed protein product, partial [Mesorhabditis spiculigera]
MKDLFQRLGGETEENIEILVENVNNYNYCSNKIMAAKRWAKNRANNSDEGYDIILFVEAMCISNSYTMGQVYDALAENGPLDLETLAELKRNYTEDYASVYGSDAMRAFTWFTIRYMQLLDYEENALAKMKAALKIVQQRYSPFSLAELELLRAYRILMWDELNDYVPPSAGEEEIFIFNQTMEYINDFWQEGDRFLASLRTTPNP